MLEKKTLLPPITVIVADDHAILREGIVAILSRHEHIKIVGEAANGVEAVALFNEFMPSVALLDLKMPEMSGLDAMIAIRKRHPAARILALTTYNGDALIHRAINAGAAGYLLKQSIRTELSDAIATVHSGRRYIPEDVAVILSEYITTKSVSDREAQILLLIAEGFSNRTIGVALEISEETVKTHVKSIFAKIGARDRTHAVIIAKQRGII